MNAHTPIKLEVNTNRLINNLSTVFSSQNIFLRELIQNARRAGSKSVEITTQFDDKTGSLDIKIQDRGEGISNLQSLFTLAESGWHDELITSENAFGMGFYSVLYCVNAVRITSLNNVLEFKCQDLLSGKTAIPRVNEDCHEGTLIELFGVNLSEDDSIARMHATNDDIQRHVKEYALSEDLLITLNGELLDAPLARRSLSNCELVKCEIGDIYLMKNNGKVVIPDRTYIKQAYILQGIKVFNNSSWSNPDVIVHLNSNVEARMPDRDKLINQCEVQQVIEKHLCSYYSNLLSQDWEESVKAGDDDKLLSRNWDRMTQYCPDIVNKLSKVPTTIFSNIGYPTAEACLNEQPFTIPGKYVISRTELEQYKVFANAEIVITGTDMCDYTEADYALGMWVSKTNQLVLHNANAIPKDHWVHKMVEEFNNSDIETYVTNASDPTIFNGNWLDRVPVLFAEKVQVAYKGEAVQITDAFFDGESIIVPSQSSDGEVVNQLCTFENENDQFLEGDQATEEELFAKWVLSARINSPEELLKTLLADMRADSIERLTGKTLIVHFEKSNSSRPTIVVEECP